VPAGAVMAGPRPRVLVIDDSSTVRAGIADCLRGFADCLEAENGKQGFDRMRLDCPDAVIADLEMPVMDGLSFLRAARGDALCRAVPVLICTSVMSVDAVNECRALGCAGLVLKPVSREYLLAKLGRMLHG